jgi:chaperonin GroEL
MPITQLLFRTEARERVLKGASALADAVRLTLGPKSRSVLIERKWGKPLVCNDGVTIAKEITLRDSVENMGAQMMRAARGVYVDLVEAGIIDSTKVVRMTLENAVSVAGTLLLAEATLSEEPERPQAQPSRLMEQEP